jgi:TonB family protein
MGLYLSDLSGASTGIYTRSQMKSRMSLLLFATALLLAPIHSQTQDTNRRRLLDHVAPSYPALARTMALEGVVKVDTLVAPDGSVKSVEVKGGHPVLTQAALNAVRRWRWEPAVHESHEVVEIKFSPGE